MFTEFFIGLMALSIHAQPDANYMHMGDKLTTPHVGIFATAYQPEDGQLALGSFCFRDSYGDVAGGIFFGPSTRLTSRIRASLMFGFYIREDNPRVHNFPHSVELGPAEVVPLVAPAINIRVLDSIALQIQTLGILTNIQIGVNF